MEETESTQTEIQTESIEESTTEETLELEPSAPITLPLTAIVSALIFSSPKPISTEKLLEISGASSEDLLEALDRIREIYSAECTGYSLVEVSGGFVFRTAVELAPMIKKLLPPKIKKLSHAAAETLAIIVYKQPVARAEIEAIRGVDALPTLKTLLDAQLIRIIGHDSAVGQPALYGTTERFLERFGLKDLSELPTSRELLLLDNEPGEGDGSSSDLSS